MEVAGVPLSHPLTTPPLCDSWDLHLDSFLNSSGKYFTSSKEKERMHLSTLCRKKTTHCKLRLKICLLHFGSAFCVFQTLANNLPALLPLPLPQQRFPHMMADFTPTPPPHNFGPTLRACQNPRHTTPRRTPYHALALNERAYTPSASSVHERGPPTTEVSQRRSLRSQDRLERQTSEASALGRRERQCSRKDGPAGRTGGRYGGDDGILAVGMCVRT